MVGDTQYLAQLIHEALEESEWQADSQTLAEWVQRLHQGLPSEDEFSVLLAWLGKCKLVHKLEQLQLPPGAGDSYQVPDLLAIFEYDGQRIPVLIEVKSKTKSEIITSKLSWRVDYYQRLKEYGKILGLPVLVAWKCDRFWTLFEIKHFELAKTNYKISFETAQKQNLLGVLAGDFIIVLRRGVGFYLKLQKEQLLSVDEQENASRELWRARVKEAFFTNADQVRLNELRSGIWPLFLTPGVQEATEITDGEISHSIEVPDEEPMQWAHTVLTNLLELRGGKQNSVHWREVMREYDMPTKSTVLREDVREGIKRRIVRCVINQKPIQRPEFLSSERTIP